MTCEKARARILALDDLNDLSGRLRIHLDQCTGCRHHLAGLLKLEELLTAMPVPASSPGGMQRFLDSLPELDTTPAPAEQPIVTPASPTSSLEQVSPAGPKRTDADSFFARPWRYAGLAAAILIAAGIWFGSGTQNDSDKDEQALAARHQLLDRGVGHLITLTGAEAPDQRFTVWLNVAEDLRAELRDVHVIAPGEDVRALGRMYENAVTRGLLAQANKLGDELPADQRHGLLLDAANKLNETGDEAERLASTAPPQAKPVLEQLARTARTSGDSLTRLATGEGG